MTESRKCSTCGGPEFPHNSGVCIDAAGSEGHCPECCRPVVMVKVRATVELDGTVSIHPHNFPSITKEKMLEHERATRRATLHFNEECHLAFGPRGGTNRKLWAYRVNGKVKTWKTRPTEFQVPLKHGLKGPHGYVTEANAIALHLESECLCDVIPQNRASVVAAVERAFGKLEDDRDKRLVIDCTLFWPKCGGCGEVITLDAFDVHAKHVAGEDR